MAETTHYREVIKDLERARGKLESEIEALQVRCKSLVVTIETLKNYRANSSEEAPGRYIGLSLMKAAHCYLTETATPASINEVWEALQVGGLASEAANPVAVLSASMSRSDHFEHGLNGWTVK